MLFEALLKNKTKSFGGAKTVKKKRNSPPKKNKNPRWKIQKNPNKKDEKKNFKAKK